MTKMIPIKIIVTTLVTKKFKGTYAYCAPEIIKEQNNTTKGMFMLLHLLSTK